MIKIVAVTVQYNNPKHRASVTDWILLMIWVESWSSPYDLWCRSERNIRTRLNFVVGVVFLGSFLKVKGTFWVWLTIPPMICTLWPGTQSRTAPGPPFHVDLVRRSASMPVIKRWTCLTKWLRSTRQTRRVNILWCTRYAVNKISKVDHY